MQPSSSNVLNNGGDGGKQSAGMGSALFYGIVSGAVLLAVASIAFGMLVLRRQRRHKANLKAQALSGSLDGTFFSSDTSKNPLPALLPTTSYSRDYDEIFHTNMAIEEDLEEGNVNDGEIDSTVPDMVHGRAQSIGAGIITANRKSLALSRGSRGSVAYGRDRVGSLPIHTLTANTMMEPTLLNTQAGRLGRRAVC